MASTKQESLSSYPQTPILTSPTLLIRPYHTSDIPAIVKEANNPLIAQHMGPQFPYPYTTCDAATWVKIATSPTPLLNFAVCHYPSGEYAGGIGLSTYEADDVRSRAMEIGYWLGQAHWGRGLATQAVRAFSRWSFETFPEVLRLEAVVHAGNDASARVLEKAGYVFEGTRRKGGYKDGVAFDMHMYGLLREECKGLDADGSKGV